MSGLAPRHLGVALLVAFLAVFTACAPQPAEEPMEEPAAEEPAAEQTESLATVPVARSDGGTVPLPLGDPDAMNTLQGIGVTPPPTIRLTTPAADATVESDELTVGYEIENYEVGEDVGQHVHVILDDQPYKADYSPTGSVSFSAGELTPGTHMMTVFLSREMHLSLKNPEASDHVIFHVGEASDAGFEAGAPTLVYSRPKGDYAGEAAEHVMLDFYLFDVALGPDGHRVRATVDGGPAMMIDSWGPRIVLTAPTPGEHTVRLELLDAEGNPVPGPTNDTSRTITIGE